MVSGSRARYFHDVGPVSPPVSLFQGFLVFIPVESPNFGVFAHAVPFAGFSSPVPPTPPTPTPESPFHMKLYLVPSEEFLFLFSLHVSITLILTIIDFITLQDLACLTP